MVALGKFKTIKHGHVTVFDRIFMLFIKTETCISTCAAQGIAWGIFLFTYVFTLKVTQRLY